MSMKLANQVPAMILRSPVHGMLSSRYLVLEFTGRMSGRRFRTPVANRGHAWPENAGLERRSPVNTGGSAGSIPATSTTSEWSERLRSLPRQLVHRYRGSVACCPESPKPVLRLNQPEQAV